MDERDYGGERPITQIQLKNYLEQFRAQTLEDLRGVIREVSIPFNKKWMKSSEVKSALDISHGKLQTMRNSRAITFTKIGGTIFYDRADIEDMFERGKVKKNEKR